MNVKYIGPARDYSGYGEANRHDIAALLSADIDVTSKLPRYSLEIADFGALGERVCKTEGKDIEYDIVIIHTTPDQFKNYVEEGKYNIGRVFWETDKLPEAFAAGANLCNEIWTGSEFNADAIRKAGVTVPITIIPEAIDTSFDVNSLKPYSVQNEDCYKFYSIFEWTERKNPKALLTAFWEEFEHTEGVSLTIKTYVDNFTPDKKQEVLHEAREIKRKLNLSRYAPVYFYSNLMDRNQIYRFHKTHDCFVSAHRGEGWGVPQMEALLVSNALISTNRGGIHEYLTQGEDALLISNTLVPLDGNSRNQVWYTSDQQWAEIDMKELRLALRAVFDHQKESKEMALAGNKKVNELFSLEAVGLKMEARLLEIEDNRS